VNGIDLGLGGAYEHPFRRVGLEARRGEAMSFHCDKLCSGTCCVPLRITLERLGAGKLSSGHNEYGVRFVSFGSGHMCTDDKMVHPYNNAHDPAKLAELMVMGLRARGLDVACDWSDRHDFYVAWWPNDPQYVDGTQWIHVRAKRYGRFNDMPISEWDMATARAKLLAIMATSPNETSLGECERIIRGSNGV
jgi:hypothetical protein